jgi:hypothetical protein
VEGAEDPAHDGPIGESATAELTMSPPYQSAVAVLVAVLGFALVTAFILRWA